MRPIEIKGFNGIVNTAPSSRLKPGDLVECYNFFISDDGALLSRTGSELKVTGLVHSLWSDGDICLYRLSDGLYLFDSGGTSTLIRGGLTTPLPMSYTSLAGTVYYCDVVANGIIESGINRTWGLPVPVGFSATVWGGSGTLLKGLYRVTLSHLRNDGQQSGTGVPIEVNIPTDTGGIAITAITHPSDPIIVGWVGYVSPRNGKELYRCGAYLPIVVGSDSMVGSSILNSELYELLPTSQLEPPPMGTIVKTFGGRVYVAVGNYLYYSEIYSAELFNPYNFLPFEAPITMIAPYNAGIIVGTTEATYLLQGMAPEPQPFLRTLFAPYGVIKGTPAYVSIKHSHWQNGWLWASTRGICFCNEDGLLFNLTEKNYQYVYPNNMEGSGVVYYHDGFISYVVTLQGYNTEAFNIYVSDAVGAVSAPTLETIPSMSGEIILPALIM